MRSPWHFVCVSRVSGHCAWHCVAVWRALVSDRFCGVLRLSRSPSLPAAELHVGTAAAKSTSWLGSGSVQAQFRHACSPEPEHLDYQVCSGMCQNMSE